MNDESLDSESTSSRIAAGLRLYLPSSMERENSDDVGIFDFCVATQTHHQDEDETSGMFMRTSWNKTASIQPKILSCCTAECQRPVFVLLCTTSINRLTQYVALISDFIPLLLCRHRLICRGTKRCRRI